MKKLIIIVALLLIVMAGGRYYQSSHSAKQQNYSMTQQAKNKKPSFWSSWFDQHKIPQSATKAAEALQGIKYKIELGANYIEYGRMLSEAAIPVKTYLDSKEASDDVELSNLIQEIWEHYIAALTVWQAKTKYGDYFWSDSEKIKWIVRKVPLVGTLDLKSDRNVPFDEIIQKLWQAAAPKMLTLKTIIDKGN